MIKKDFQANWEQAKLYVKIARILLSFIAFPLMILKIIFEALGKLFEILTGLIIMVCGGKWGDEDETA